MVVTALVIVLGLVSTSVTDYTDVYNFPMFGALQFDHADPPYSFVTYGSLTAAHTRLVIGAAANLCQLDPKKEKFIFHEDYRNKLYVSFGSELMTPPDYHENDKVRRIKVDMIYFAKSSKFATAVNETSLKNRQAFLKTWESIQQPAPNLNGKNLKDIVNLGYVLNPFDHLQWDIALLTLQTDLGKSSNSPLIDWTPYILPIGNLLWHQQGKRNYLVEGFEKAWDIIDQVETSPHEFYPCTVPGWSPIGNNEIIYHKVVYIRFKECEEAICSAFPSACFQYLNARHHVCFKSLSFADSCFMDQGAPVVCPWTGNHTLGIMTRAWDCGSKVLPIVFTRIDMISVFAYLTQQSDQMSKIEVRLDDEKYTLKPV